MKGCEIEKLRQTAMNIEISSKKWEMRRKNQGSICNRKSQAKNLETEKRKTEAKRSFASVVIQNKHKKNISEKK